MSNPAHRIALISSARLLGRAIVIVGSFLYISAFGAETDTRNFDVPSGNAEQTLKLFSEQSGHALIASSEVVKGVKTNAVHGELASSAALDQMLDGTGLVAV